MRHSRQVGRDTGGARQRWGPGRIRVLVRDGADFPHRVLDPHYTLTSPLDESRGFFLTEKNFCFTGPASIIRMT